jgi:AcrR family transcriptional regulator
MRADARRNYDRLVEEARHAFAEHGVDTSLDEIARRAGVASGTLYRHFPTRLDLVEVVLSEQITALVERGRELLETDDEFAALSTWLRAALRHGMTYRGLSASVLNSALDRGVVLTWHAELAEVAAALITRARLSADPGDVLKMVSAIAWATQDDEAQADRLLALLVKGLRNTVLDGLSAPDQ